MSNENLSEFVRVRQGELQFFVNDSGALTRSLRKYGEWAENELTFIRHFIPSGSTVLDIGAYIGTHTLAFSRATGTDGRVISFEAQSQTFELLKKNIEANGLANVRLEHAAVGDRTGSATIIPIDIQNPESFGSMPVRIVDGQSADTPSIDVQMLTIDGLNLQACSFIKIDAEGAEDTILKGALETLRRLSPVIYAECNSVEGGLKSIAVLKNAGYDIRLHVVDAFNPHNFRGDAENIFGPAKEVALVGFPQTRLAEIDAIKPSPYELLLRIEDADDLVLGMLNKPQYPGEVLSGKIAAADGGSAWMDETKALKLEFGRVANEAEWAKGELAKTRDEVEELKVEKFHAVRAAEEAEDHARAARLSAQASLDTADQTQVSATAAEDAARRAEEQVRIAVEQVRITVENLHRIENSVSWRITRPLRWVASLFKK